MDVKYALVVFGGVAQYHSDDIGKFLWFPRIASAEFTHIRESDYSGSSGFRVGEAASDAFRNSMTYKMCFYRLNEVDSIGKGNGYDRNRDVHIKDEIKFRHFEEAYTSHNWIVRIYRVIRPESRNDLNYGNTAMDSTIQHLSGISQQDEKLDLPSHTVFNEKTELEYEERDNDENEDEEYEGDYDYEDEESFDDEEHNDRE